MFIAPMGWGGDFHAPEAGHGKDPDLLWHRMRLRQRPCCTFSCLLSAFSVKFFEFSLLLMLGCHSQTL
jgi:hypothetical protein